MLSPLQERLRRLVAGLTEAGDSYTSRRRRQVAGLTFRRPEQGGKPTVVCAVSLTAHSCIIWMRGLLVYRPQLCCRCVWN